MARWKNLRGNRQGMVRNLCLICLALGILLILLLGDSENGSRDLREQPDYRELTVERTLRREYDGYAGVEKEYRLTLPEVAPGEYVFIYLVHQYAQVYLDGEPVALSEEPEGWHLGKTPGCYWISVPVLASDSGRELRIVTQPVYAGVTERTPTLGLSGLGDTLRVWTEKFLADMLLCVLCIIGGLLFTLLSAAVPLERREQVQLYFLGLFTLSVGLWRLCDLPVMSLLFPSHSRLLYYISALGLLFAPLLFTQFLRWQRSGPGTGIYRAMAQLFTVETLLLLILQLLNLLDLRAEMYFLLAAVVVAAVPVFVLSLLQLLRREVKGIAALRAGIYIAFVLGALLDVYFYLRNGSSAQASFLISVTVLHLVVMSVIIIRGSLERQRRMYAMEAELLEERSRLMLSQIQPHFLYNSLGVIRELCRSDPEKAEFATISFAQYLRGNMNTLTTDRPIAFADELQHTKNYLALEQLRFGDSFAVRYEIETDAFRLPALTLQPIVENAVRHGMRRREEGGVITVRTREQPEGYTLTVEDDGPGFDPAHLAEDGQKHIGLKNVQNRLTHTIGGSLEIDSAPGRGTVVTIFIPKET